LSRSIRFGYSTCPNDTFAFHALMHGLVEAPGFKLSPVLDDVEELNRRALQGELELSKLSFHALGHLLDKYALLRSGSALGRGCGPLLICRPGQEKQDLKSALVAVPGKLTTAHLLLSLYLGGAPRVEAMEFSQIMPAVKQGRAQAGLIIHEGRFTYQAYGLSAIQDLGEWWEQATGLPIPLGCIAVRRDLGAEAAGVLEKALRDSIRQAWQHPDHSREYVMQHAQEMEPQVVQQHIDLYVNQFSQDLGDEGVAAVQEMLRRGETAGMFEMGGKNLFI
jgi:1,4-dihydroxy-6-naphthoate synthase